MWTSYLDWALSDFSGYIAADELYDGPFCVLSIVDNRTFKRLLYQVLDHDPDHPDITKFFRRFRMALRLRRLTLHGVTTDASPLYPEPLRAVFGSVALTAFPEIALVDIGLPDLDGYQVALLRGRVTQAEQPPSGRLVSASRPPCISAAHFWKAISLSLATSFRRPSSS